MYKVRFNFILLNIKKISDRVRINVSDLQVDYTTILKESDDSVYPLKYDEL